MVVFAFLRWVHIETRIRGGLHRRQNVYRTACQQILGFRAVGRHVRRGSVCFQGVEVGPFFDDQESVGPVFFLKAGAILEIDRGAVLDAAVLGFDGGDVGAKCLQDGVPHAGFGGDNGDDVNHGGVARHYARPPVIGLEFEMDVLGAARELVIESA